MTLPSDRPDRPTGADRQLPTGEPDGVERPGASGEPRSAEWASRAGWSGPEDEPQDDDQPGPTDEPHDDDQPGPTDEPHDDDRSGPTDEPQGDDQPGPTDEPQLDDRSGPADNHDPVDRPGVGSQLGRGVRAEARRAIEAIVLVSEQPVDINLLAQLLELRPAIIEELCRELAAEYADQGRGFQLARVAGGWRFQTHPDQAPYVERFVLEGQTTKLSAAALETLAIVAYKQPISRAQVASIRGVSVDGVMRTLQQRGYIAQIGRDSGPGQAVMFGTTRAFLEKLGVDALSDLPVLGDFVPGADVVEQLERGLRPDGPTIPERLDTLEGSNTQRDADSRVPNGIAGPHGRDRPAHRPVDLDDPDLDEPE